MSTADKRPHPSGVTPVGKVCPFESEATDFDLPTMVQIGELLGFALAHGWEPNLTDLSRGTITITYSRATRGDTPEST